MRFSERIGAVRRVLQKESIDDSLKNALWNTAYGLYWRYYADATIQRVDHVEEGRLLIDL